MKDQAPHFPHPRIKENYGIIRQDVSLFWRSFRLTIKKVSASKKQQHPVHTKCPTFLPAKRKHLVLNFKIGTIAGVKSMSNSIALHFRPPTVGAVAKRNVLLIQSFSDTQYGRVPTIHFPPTNNRSSLVTHNEIATQIPGLFLYTAVPFFRS